MDPKLFATVFFTVFIAELGDKTQLATLLYAADTRHSKWVVFIAASGALIVAAGLGVLGGSWVSSHLSPELLRWVAGIGFISVGLWVLYAG